MRRIISVLAGMAIVAAMAVAMAMPALAAGGTTGQGHADAGKQNACFHKAFFHARHCE